VTRRNQRIKWIGWIIGVGLLVLFPFISGSGYLLHLMIISGIWIIMAQGLNVILGYTGLLSLGQGGLFGVGAYVSAILMVRLGWSFWAAMPAATLVSALIGLAVGYPVLRTKGIYFAIVTLGLGVILSEIFDNWIEVTRGPMGISDIPFPSPIDLGVTSIEFASKTSYYYLVVVIVLVAIWAIYRVARSNLGRALIAIKEDEILATSYGMFPPTFKLIAFIICSAFAGLAGCLYASYISYISPASFGVYTSIDAVIIVVIGSAGTVMGPILGTIILVLVPEALRFASEYRMLVFAVILFLVTVYMPQGLGRAISRVFRSNWLENGG